jgi:hypothetical protein
MHCFNSFEFLLGPHKNLIVNSHFTTEKGEAQKLSTFLAYVVGKEEGLYAKPGSLSPEPHALKHYIFF